MQLRRATAVEAKPASPIVPVQAVGDGQPATASSPSSFSPWRIRPLLIANVVAAAFYASWWLENGHIGTPVLFAALAAAEAFGFCHVLGLWWTVWFTHVELPPPIRTNRSVDVFITTCGEPLPLLERTLGAALALRGAHQTYVLDDAQRSEVADLAERRGAFNLTRSGRRGAKAGNLNRALEGTSGELVCVFDADHAPQPDFLERLLGYFEDPQVAFVQSPQVYVNARYEAVARGAYQQQAIFYGPICRGKNGLNAAFCCGTNVVFRRAALDDVGGFDERSVVEDFVTSIRIHSKGWRSVYYPYALVEGLGPESLGSYFRQQFRWARGSVGALVSGEPFRRGLSLAQRFQYLLATTFYLTGIFTAVYVLLPILYLIGGWSAFSPGSETFALFYVPYLVFGLLTIRLVLGQLTLEHLRYRFGTFPVYAVASVGAILRVTPKFGVTGEDAVPRFPPLAAVSVVAFLATAVAIALGPLLRPLDPMTFTNISWALVNLNLLSGITAAAVRALSRPAARVPIRGGRVRLLHDVPNPVHLQLSGRVPSPSRARASLRTFAAERTTLYIAFLTLAALGLRMALIDVQSIRLDESLSLTEARAPFSTLLGNLASWDIHPPLYYTLLHGWVALAGASPLALRLPSVLSGAACVPLVYLIGRRLVGPRAALLASAVAAASPFLVWHSDEARMYPFYLLTSLLALWALMRAAQRNDPAGWIVYGFVTAVSLYAHYFAVLMIPVHLVYLVTIRAPRRMFYAWAAAGGAAVLTFLPWLLFLALRRGGLTGIGTLETGLVAPAQHYSLLGTMYSIVQFPLVYLIGYDQALAGGGILGIAALMIAGSWPLLAVTGGLSRELGRILRSPRIVFIELWIVLTLGTVFALNLWKHDLWLQRYLIISSPALYLLLGLALSRMFGRRLALGLALVLTAFVVATLVDNFDPRNQLREDWRGASALITRQGKPGDSVIVMPWFYVTPLRYYYRAKLPVYGLLRTDRSKHIAVSFDIRRLASRHPGSALWVIIAYENTFDAEGRIRATLDRTYRLTADYRLGGEMELRRYVERAPPQVDVGVGSRYGAVRATPPAGNPGLSRMSF